jgi:hypothetical protein
LTQYVGSAALPLFALIDDDFGVGLILPEEPERIRRRLIEYDLREASVSS